MQLQKISTLTNFLNLLFVYIQGSPHLCQPFLLINHTQNLFWYSNLDEPRRKNFVFIIIQLSEVEIQESTELL